MFGDIFKAQTTDGSFDECFLPPGHGLFAQAMTRTKSTWRCSIAWHETKTNNSIKEALVRNIKEIDDKDVL